MDIDLCDDLGRICARMKGLLLRALQRTGTAAGAGGGPGSGRIFPFLLLFQNLRQQEPAGPRPVHAQGDRHVLVCGMASISLTALEKELPHVDIQRISQPESGEKGATLTLEEMATRFQRALHPVVRLYSRSDSGRWPGKDPVSPIGSRWCLKIRGSLSLYSGLGAFLSTAGQENPRIKGADYRRTSGNGTFRAWSPRIQENFSLPFFPHVRYPKRRDV